MATNKEIKSNRLLQARRFTLNGLADTQEAFTQVLDLNSSEIYSQQDLIPSSGLPFSGSSQNGATTEVMKYWFRHKLTKANDGTNTAWFFLTTYGGNDGVTAQLINNQQETNFISPKYSIASIANANTEDAIPGYNVRVFVSTNSSTPAAGDVRPVTDYTYNFKYGVLNFETNAPTNNQFVYITAYQYTGRTLASDQILGYSGSFSGSFEGTANLNGNFSGSFEGNGGGLTNIPASGIVGLNLTQIGLETVTASVDTGNTSFSVISGSSNLLSLTKQGTLTVSGSEVIGGNLAVVGDSSFTGSLETKGNILTEQNLTVGGITTLLGDSSITGSLEISQNLIVQGTASFSYFQSITGSAKIIGDAFIILNADVPASRFAGIKVIDTGSAFSTSSFIYDGEANQWIFEHEGSEKSGSSVAIFGPLNTGPLGNEQGLIEFSVPRAYTDHGHHIGTSNIFSTGSFVTINKGNTGSLGTEVDILGSVTITGSTIQSTPLPTATTTPESTGNYGLLVSQSAWFFNHNAGVPRSNAWKNNLNGSYFNTFDHNTNVSEILRFVAGLLSSSAPSPTPNTKTYGSLSEVISNNTSTTTNPIGFIPQNSTNSDIIYLNSKGWANTGSSIFNGLTIYSNPNYFIRYSSVFAGSTTISSSADTQLFGLGELDNPVRVSGSISFRFEQSNDNVATATSSSQQLIELLGSAPQSIGGVQKNIINTANPAVIPAAFQDGKFVNIFQSGLHNGGISFSSISSSGFYEINATIGISSSLASGFNNKSIGERIFWSEVVDGDFVQNTITHQPSYSTLTATSRSLSGAPYLRTATWNYQDTASGVFNPMYHESTPIFELTDSSTLVTIGGTTSQAMSGGNIATTSLIFDSAGSTQRAVGTIPHETDIIKTSNTVTFNAGTSDNIEQSTITPVNFTVTAKAEDRDGTDILSVTTIPFHEAGTFAQPASSGSLAFYGEDQNFDGGTFTRSNAGSLVANFTGESRRLQINDNVLSGSYNNGTAWDTTFQVYNLAGNDLQIKPGFLIKPGDSFKYWLNDPDPTQTFKYYAVAFNRNIASNQPNITMTLAGNTTLVNWTATTNNSVAALIIPESVLATTANASGIDPTAAATNVLALGDSKNPFGTSLTVLANTNAQKTNPFIIDFPTTPNAFPLNTTYRNFVVLIRYIGNPTPLTSITLTVTA